MKQIELMTIEDLRQYLGIGKNTAYDLVKKGRIRAFKAGRGWIVPRPAVEEFIESALNDR